MKKRNMMIFRRYRYLLTTIQSTLKVNLQVRIFYINVFMLGNMFQHKYLIYNRDCTLLTYAVQTKIKIDDQATYKDVKFENLIRY